ncbi:PBSX family phage terminase large subunit [Erysipelothrix sp. HDW6C]|uniref:PBSX family phage terminase large subunit n=1 Tax=Erysipelothrix sp. HDW6C TaxID=2714930 RepID=UPI00140B68C0|nr:PBSX family phage terminase large subunit [Erysipelothrix sp. HDW6C]QIK70848.1 PBSX family phage terminase large subunit [Erysipelothrix sp. HDW6C]
MTLNRKQITLSSQIMPKLHPIASPTKLQGVEDIILTSGRIGGKSSAQGINVSNRALTNPSAHVMMRKNHNKLRQTVFTETKRAFSRLGIKESRSLVVRKAPYMIKVKKNDSTIYFSGSDNPDDTKGMIDENFPIETVTLDEVNEFFKMGYDRGKEEIDNIKATFIRGNTADNFRMFYMFNPPKNPHAPVMQWLEEKKYIHDEDGNRLGLNPKTLHIHVSYLDMPVEWIGQAVIDSAEETKRIDEEYYRWLWLGECIGVRDVIYHMFNENHIKAYHGQQLTNIGIGVDYGQMNATTFNAFGIDMKEKALQGIASYRHSGREQKQKSVSDYALDMYNFVLKVEQLTRQPVVFIVIDPSAKGFAEEVKKVFRERGKGIKIIGADNDVSTGITRTQALLTVRAFYVDPTMFGAINEFRMYQYNPLLLDKGIEKPLKENDHDMDGIRYLVMEQHKYMKRIRPLLANEERSD